MARTTDASASKTVETQITEVTVYLNQALTIRYSGQEQEFEVDRVTASELVVHQLLRVKSLCWEER